MDSSPSRPAGLVWWETAAVAAGSSPAPAAGPTAARPAGRVAGSGVADPGRGPDSWALGPGPQLLAPDLDQDLRASADCREYGTASRPGCRSGCGRPAGGKVQGQTLQWRK